LSKELKSIKQQNTENILKMIIRNSDL